MSSFDDFLHKWSQSGASEASNAQSFTNDLCDLIGVDKPDPTLPDESQNTYVFEKSVPSSRGIKKIDCYRRGYFILENKQGAFGAEAGAKLSAKKQAEQKARKTGHGKRGSNGWDTAMERAKKQAENYARLPPADEINGGRPPFIMVADVGHSIAVYADWSRAGGHYQPFPGPNNYRIKLQDLEQDDIRERLRLIWSDPLSLDPARRSAKVTKQIADRLAKLANLSTTFNTDKNKIGIRVYISNKKVEEWLPYFESKKIEIEGELQEKLVWNPNPENRDKVILLSKQFPLDDKSDWPNAIGWLQKQTLNFKRVFSRVIKEK